MITKQGVYEKADKYLILNMGNLVRAGEPTFDAKKRIWTVPIVYQSNFASFFLDSMVFNTNGKTVYVPTRDRLCELVDKRLSGEISIKIKIKPEKEKLEEVRKFVEKMKPRSVMSQR